MEGPDSMLHHLGQVARARRRAARWTQLDIALRAGVDERTIRNFEQGRHWPQDPDRMVLVYATELGVDPRDLWDDALRRWEAAR